MDGVGDRVESLQPTLEAASNSPMKRIADDDLEDFDIVDLSDAVLDLTMKEGGISKAHWKPPGANTNCQACHLKFDLIDKKHWCHRCGGLFCKSCVSYRRKLSPQATPDPIHGMYYNVCINCFKQEPEQSVGPSRNYSNHFTLLRNQHLKERDSMVRHAAAALCQACKESGMASSISKSLGIDPEWTKVNFCAKKVASSFSVCLVCQAKFGITLHRHHCRLCGRVFCDKCLFRSIEIFDDETGNVKLDILHPEYEREKSIILRGCEQCLEALEKATKLEARLQRSLSRSMSTGTEVTEATLFEAKFVQPSPAFEKVMEVHPKIVKALKLLQTTISQFQEDINSLVGKEKSGSLQGISLKLAKHEGDVKGLFSSLRTFAQILKKTKARPMNVSEKRIAENLYTQLVLSLGDNVGPFRACCSALMDFFPEGVLAQTRALVDAEGLKNTLLVVRQLGIESLLFEDLKDVSVALAGVTQQLHGKIRELMEISNSEQFVDDVMEKVDKFVHLSIKTNSFIIKYQGNPKWKELVLSVWNSTFRAIYTQLKRKTSLEVIGVIEPWINEVWKEGCDRITTLQRRDVEEEKEWEMIDSK
eukprot:m.26254 g.26254  ORF g.26254 m.26254 type:complete len:590 (+) comp5842_c0_seq1:108-1877(+)